MKKLSRKLFGIIVALETRRQASRIAEARGLIGNIDYCPECKEKYVGTCKCRINERTCRNGHSWYKEGKEIILGTKHGRVK
jgi:hypothetical protein